MARVRTADLDVVVVRIGEPLLPFGVVADDCPLGAGTFGSYRLEVLAALALAAPRFVDPPERITGPALVLADDTWVTRRALRGFLRAAAPASAPARLCLRRTPLLDMVLPLQDVALDEQRVAFGCAFVPAGHEMSAHEVLQSPTWVAVDQRGFSVDVPVPRHILQRADGTIEWLLTSTFAMRIRHWLHVLRAAHVFPQIALLESAVDDPIRTAWRLLAGLRPGPVARTEAWKRAFKWVGDRSFIHKSAVVEASVIGDDVYVGPQAVILQSVIGDGCRIEQRAHVAQSTLGPKTFVSLNSSISASVTFGDCDACANNMQGCVVGPRAALTSFSRALDTIPGKQVRVDDRGTLREVGPLPCGVAFGPGVYAGAHITIAPGRALPAGVRLSVPADDVLRRVPRDLTPGDYTVIDGMLRPR